MSEDKEKEKQVVAYEVAPYGNVELVYNKPIQRVEYCVIGNDGNFAFQKELETEDVVYRPPIIIEQMAKKNFLFLPSRPEEYGADAELAETIYNFLYDYVDYSDEYRKLDVWYAKFSWVHDLFPILPYRRALGDTGRGKTRWATVLGSICRMAYFQGAATTSAPIYRLSDLIRGTMIIDENYFSTKTEQGQAVLAILNSGYSKTTGFVMRCIGENYRPAFFVTYGPKLVAARYPFPDEATENRTISHFAYETDRDDISRWKSGSSN